MLQRHLHPRGVTGGKVEGTGGQTRTGLEARNALDAMGLKYASDKLAHCRGVGEISWCLWREAR